MATPRIEVLANQKRNGLFHDRKLSSRTPGHQISQIVLRDEHNDGCLLNDTIDEIKTFKEAKPNILQSTFDDGTIDDLDLQAENYQSIVSVNKSIPNHLPKPQKRQNANNLANPHQMNKPRCRPARRAIHYVTPVTILNIDFSHL